VNVTIPFKEEAASLVDEIPEDLDRCVGAINTIVNKEGMLYGYNTDLIGFLTDLKESLNFNPEGKKILVLGAGGAARAVVFALGRAHAEKILVHNRTFDRAESLISYALDYFPETDIDALENIADIKNEKKIDLVINATASGMKGDTSVPMDLKLVNGNPAVYDLVYSPAKTPFLKEAEKMGFATSNGLGMLAEQAALAFELWTGKKEGIRDLMLETIKKCL
jgi:shikimate dehydrogenase